LARSVRVIFATQGLRAFGYGFGSVLLGSTLAAEGLSTVVVGAVLTAMIAGTALASVVVGSFADRAGRRRVYASLLLIMGAAGTVFALTQSLPWLIAAALTGTIATEANDSGPMTSLEQVMIGHASEHRRTYLFGRYNAVAYAAGSLGALSAAVPGQLGRFWPAFDAGPRWFLVFPVVALAAAGLTRWLGPEVELAPLEGEQPPKFTGSRGMLAQLSGLFALDSFGGGFVTQAFLVFWLGRRFGAGLEVLGPLFFVTGLLQMASSLTAGPIAGRIGLIRTMVFTQIPANLLLVAVAFAPNLVVAVPCLLVRYLLAQADIPARQAFVIGIFAPNERTAASVYTNMSRYAVKPLAPIAGGVLMQVAFQGPLLAAAGIKISYDLLLYYLFRQYNLERENLPDSRVVAAARLP
jgi:MFS family permease